jgi:hypothetical protein
MVLCGGALGRQVAGADNLEVAAATLTRSLQETLWDSTSNHSAAVLTRFYRTIAFASLEPGLREVAQAAAGSPLGAKARCLTLMGTAGDQPAWNSRHESVRHRAIPLTSEQAVERLPMVARLITDLGMSVGGAVAGRWDESELKRLGNGRVFYVRDAQGSAAVPDQQTFVMPHGVRSVIGFGGPLESGDFWALIMFTRVEVTPAVAQLFRMLATDVKIALLPVLTRRLFAA